MSLSQVTAYYMATHTPILNAKPALAETVQLVATRLSTYFVSKTLKVTLFSSTTILHGRHFYLHFADEEIDIQKYDGTCLRLGPIAHLGQPLSKSLDFFFHYNLPISKKDLQLRAPGRGWQSVPGSTGHSRAPTQKCLVFHFVPTEELTSDCQQLWLLRL